MGRGRASMLPLFALHFWLWVKVVNPCLILSCNSFDKLTGIIFIVRQEIPRNIKRWVLFWSSVNIHGAHLAETFGIPKMLVRIDCTAPIDCIANFAHNQGVHDLDIFITDGIFAAARASIIINTLSPPLKLCCQIFHCAIRRRLLPSVSSKFFYDFFLGGRHSFLTEVLDNRSDFKFSILQKCCTPSFKSALFLWIICVIYVLCLSCFRDYILLPCDHLLGKGWPLASCLWCLIVILSFSHGVYWARYGTWLYWFLIFAVFLTYISNQPWPYAFHTPNVLQLHQTTNWQRF